METNEPRAALALLVARHGASYAQLSRLIGRNAAYLQQFVTRGSPRRLAEEDRQTLAAYFGVDAAILGGAGAATGGVIVPRLDIAAAAGAGALVDAEPGLGELTLDARLIARLRVRPQNLSLIRAAGDSMLPGIADGDELLVDRGDRTVGTRPAIFVIRHDDALLVKRVSRAAGRYLIASDNPAFAVIEAADIAVIGRVVWLSRALR
jgi:repressor LexA